METYLWLAERKENKMALKRETFHLMETYFWLDERKENKMASKRETFHLMETYLCLVERKENKMAPKRTKELKTEPMFQPLMVWMLELKSMVNCLGDLIFVC